MRTEFSLLLLALIFFAISIAVDQVKGHIHIPAYYTYEDGSKLFGILSWFSYFVRLAMRELGTAITPTPRMHSD